MKAKQSKDISRRLSKIITQNIYGMFCETHNKHTQGKVMHLAVRRWRSATKLRPELKPHILPCTLCCYLRFSSARGRLRRDQFRNQNDTPITYGTVWATVGSLRRSGPRSALQEGTPPCFSSPSKWIFSYGWLFGLPFFCFNRTVYQRARRIGTRIRIPSFGTPCLW